MQFSVKDMGRCHVIISFDLYTLLLSSSDWAFLCASVSVH